MNKLKRLPKSIHSAMHSSVVFSDLPRVVEELIFNSIDAGSTKVSIFVSITDCYVKVEDDGSGISRDGLVLLGENFATSKKRDSSTMDSDCGSFGFRGEALGSLSDIALVEIRTKARGRPNSYCKIIKGWKCLFLGIDDQRSTVGTTVVARDLFYNQPVRRKCMQTSSKSVLHSVKKCVLRTALIHPQLSFRLLDIESEEELLCTIPSPSPLQLISDVFGNELSSALYDVFFCDEALKLSGYFSCPKDLFSTKDFQYLYVNSRYVCKGAIHSLINTLVSRLYCSSYEPETHCAKRRRTQEYPAYLLNLCCSLSYYDMNIEPSKTIIEFKDWSIVRSFFERAIQYFCEKLVGQSQKGSDDVNCTNEKFVDVRFCSEIESFNCNSDKLEEVKGSIRSQIPGMQYNHKFARSCTDLFHSDFSPEDHISSNICSEYKDNWDMLGLEVKDDSTEDDGNRFFKKKCTPYSAPSIIKNFEHVWFRDANCFSLAEGVSKNSILEDALKSSDSFLDNDDVLSVSNHDDACVCLLQDEGGLFSSEVALFQNKVFASNPSVSVLRKCGASLQSAESPDTSVAFSYSSTSGCKEGLPFDCLKCEPMEMVWSIDCPHAMSKRSSQRIGDLAYPRQFVEAPRRYSGMTKFKTSDSNVVCGSVSGSTKSKFNNVEYFNRQTVMGSVYSPDVISVEKANTSNELDVGTKWLTSDSSVEVYLDNNSESIPSSHRIAEKKWGKQQDRYQLANRSRKGSKRCRSAPPFYKGKCRFRILSDHLSSATGKEHVFPLRGTSQTKPGQLCLNDQIDCFDASPPNFPLISHEVSSPFSKGWSDEKSIKDEVGEALLGKWYANAYHDMPDTESSGVAEETKCASVNLMKCRKVDSRPTVDDRNGSKFFRENQDDILDISSGLLHLAGSSLGPENISRDCLRYARVLLQLDRKFIPVIADRVLIAIDQHAADERIRLEELRQKVLSGEGTSITYLDNEKDLVLPEIGFQILQQYTDQIQKWGWTCNTRVDSGSFGRDMDLMKKRSYGFTLVAVPCILGTDLSEKDLVEYLEQLIDTDGSSALPPSVVRVLNFKACRGAIMFGDSLLPSESALLVEELRGTSLCFQCAHGRPTMAPLVDLASLHKQLAFLRMQMGRQPGEPWHGLVRRTLSIDRARQRLSSAKRFGNNG